MSWKMLILSEFVGLMQFFSADVFDWQKMG